MSENLDQRIRELASLLAPDRKVDLQLRQGVVYSVEYGTITVQLSGSPLPIGNIRYLNSYVPVVGESVWLIKNGPDLIAIGHVADLYTPVTVEAPHVVGAAGEPAFQNGWSNFGGGFEGARFWKDPEGVVHLEGLVSGGAVTSAIFTLPVGYRPASPKRFLSMANSVVTSFQVFSDGVVRQTATGSTSNAWINLSNCSFVAESALDSPPFIVDRQIAGSPLVALDTEAPEWPSCFRRSDGWWLYKGYLGGSAASGNLRLMPEDSWPEWHALFRVLAMTATTTGHIGKRVDISARAGGYIESPESTGVRMSMDQIRWWEHNQRHGWTNLPAYQNGWSNYSSTPYWGPGQYRKDQYEMVHLRGLIAPGTTATNTIISTLPVGFRPANRIMCIIPSSGGTARMDVNSNGNVVVASGGDGYGTTYASLDQIRFRAAA